MDNEEGDDKGEVDDDGSERNGHRDEGEGVRPFHAGWWARLREWVGRWVVGR